MADKNIGALDKIENVTDDALLIVEQNGAAGKVEFGQVRGFVAEAASPYVSAAQRYAKEAESASEEAADEAAERAAEHAVRNVMSSLETAVSMAEAVKNQSDNLISIAAQNVSVAQETKREAAAEAEKAKESAEAAQQALDMLDINMLLTLIAGRADGHEYDENEGLLYLTSDGVRIEGTGVKVATSGGGGGGSQNNAVMSLQNTTGWVYKSIASGASCPISFTWSSLEDGLSTGPGVLKIAVNGTVKHQASIEQGEKTLDIGEYLGTGTNSIKVTVTDVYGNSRPIAMTVIYVELSLGSKFDEYAIQRGAIEYTYIPTGSAVKTVHIILDGKELGPVTVTASGDEQPFTIPAQTHGAHTLEVYFEAVVDGETVESNRLYYMLICVEEGNTRPVIASPFRATSIEQYDTVEIPYWVYDPSDLTADIVLSDGRKSEPRSVDRTLKKWSYRADNAGNLTLSITCGTSILMFELNVTESTINVNAETNNLSLHLTSYGRSNDEANPAEWKYGSVAAEFSGFNFTSDGWQTDDDGVTVLRVSGDARLNIPVQLFKSNFSTSGKTIEVEFASRDVLNYDAVLLSCMSGGRGLEITAQQAFLTSEQSTIGTRYKEDEHLRLTFVVEKRAGNRMLLCYINGILSGATLYPDGDDFAQLSPVTISVGSNDCTIDLYNIRVYDNDLTRRQVLNNWIADTQLAGERADRYNRNNIYDDYRQVVIDKLPKSLPYLVIECPVLPSYKGDKKTCSGYYVDPVDEKNSFRFTDAEIDVQGTSSKDYYVKNFKIKFKGGFILWNGTSAEVYQLNRNVIPTNEYTFKADVASSEGANNVVLAKLYNDLCPVKTPPQEEDGRVRQTIDGHPIVIFWDNGSGPKFAGKYNFNHDKGTPEVFGFTPGDESWEIRQNGTERVGWHSSDFSGDAWKTDFEARYPKDNVNTTNLKAFADWLVLTDTDAVSGDAEKAARLQKFHDELPDHANVDALVFYYLFTLVFLCIDQREKNAFPTLFADMAKWLVLFYDADSSLGTDNKGNLAFDYFLEDIDYTEGGDPVFNGQNSVLWKNLRETYWEEIKALYQHWRTTIGEDGRPLLSYEVVNDTFAEHQSKWTEAIFNEDGYKKSIEPYEKNGTTLHISMLQGKKEMFFKWWLYNRFRYMDSLFEAGTSLEKHVTIRAHSKSDVKLTSYVTMYGRVYYNSDMVGHRMYKGNEQTFAWNASGAEDPVITINDADMLTSLGDLSPLMVELIDVAPCKHLTYLKIGDGASTYRNTYLNSVTLGNNRLLTTFDARNCVNMAQAIDFSGCTNIEHIYLDGTAVTGASLPNGGILKTLHLPGTVTNLTIRNQSAITDFVLPDYSHITTLRLENVSDEIPMWDILSAIPEGSRVRLIGFDWSFDSAADILSFYDRLDTMRGLDENGGTVDKAQLGGTIRVDSITGAELADMQSRYPNIKVVYQHITSYLRFYNGSTLLYTASVADGADGTYGGSTPTKASTAQYNYSFVGWSKTDDGTVDSDALKNVTADRNVYACFIGTVRTYTVTWKNGSTTLETDTNVPYGTVPTYDGSTPVYNGDGDAADYEFNGWTPAVGAITGDTTYTAVWKYSGYIYPKIIDRSLAGDYVNETVESIGACVFWNCHQLTTVKFPVVASVGSSAFQNCSKLTTVDLPVATSVGSAFSSCSSLTALILRSEMVATLSSNYAFMNTPIESVSGTGYIYVPRGLVDSYKTATNWSNFANKFRAIEDYPEITGGETA